MRVDLLHNLHLADAFGVKSSLEILTYLMYAAVSRSLLPKNPHAISGSARGLVLNVRIRSACIVNVYAARNWSLVRYRTF